MPICTSSFVMFSCFIMCVCVFFFNAPTKSRRFIVSNVIFVLRSVGSTSSWLTPCADDDAVDVGDQVSSSGNHSESIDWTLAPTPRYLQLTVANCSLVDCKDDQLDRVTTGKKKKKKKLLHVYNLGIIENSCVIHIICSNIVSSFLLLAMTFDNSI